MEKYTKEDVHDLLWAHEKEKELQKESMKKAFLTRLDYSFQECLSFLETWISQGNPRYYSAKITTLYAEDYYSRIYGLAEVWFWARDWVDATEEKYEIDLDFTPLKKALDEGEVTICFQQAYYEE